MGNLKSIPWWIWLIPTAFLVLAIARMPLGYYTVTRIVVFGIAVWIAFCGLGGGHLSKIWAAVFALLAVLFNPIVPVYLPRLTWIYCDIVAATLFFVHMLFYRLKRDA